MKILNWITKNWKTIGVVTLVIIALAGGLIAYHYYDLLQAEKQKSMLAQAAKNDFIDTVGTHYKDKSGNDHYSTSAGQNTINQTTIAQNPKTSLGGADTAAMVLNIQRQQIEDWKQIALTSKAELLKAKVVIDSLQRKQFVYSKGKLNITYNPLDSTFSYQNDMQLTVLQYWKKSWLLGSKKSYIDISTNDPFTTISGFKTLTIVPDRPSFNLIGNVRTSYDFSSGHLIPSAGVDFILGNFDFSGRYYYSQRLQKFTPLVSATYNFFTLKK